MNSIHLDAPIEVPETVQSFKCAICEKIGAEEYPDASSYNDEIGKALTHAQLAPNGAWVCSRGCLSQLMFQSATEEQQAKLKRFEFALCELEEVAACVRPMLDAWECGSSLDESFISDAKDALGYSANRWHVAKQPLPAWIESNIDPQDILREAISQSLLHLEYRGIQSIASAIDFQHRIVRDIPEVRFGSVNAITVQELAKVSFSLASIMIRLKAALAGKAAE
jgi:hypothetical protein